jgi:hypothetical protein
MTGPTPDERPGRERGPVAELARLFLGQLAAVIGIAAAIVVLVAVLRPDGNDDITAAAPRASATATPSASPSATATPSTPPPSSAAPTSTTPVAPATSSTPEVRQLKVDVLNQSAAQGAADRVAKRLETAGYTIGRIDDFHGNVSTTTVYWLDPRDEDQARVLSKALGGVRVMVGFDTLVDGRVSVVLVDGDW